MSKYVCFFSVCCQYACLLCWPSSSSSTTAAPTTRSSCGPASKPNWEWRGNTNAWGGCVCSYEYKDAHRHVHEGSAKVTQILLPEWVCTFLNVMSDSFQFVIATYVFLPDLEALLKLKEAGELARDARQLERLLVPTLPKVYHNVYRREEGILKAYKRLDAIPKRFLSDKNVRRTESYVELKSLIRYVDRLHPGLFANGIEVNLSADGVPETNSGSKTLHVRFSYHICSFLKYYLSAGGVSSVYWLF